MIELRLWREKRGLTRKEVADAMAMSLAAYGRRERGEVPLTGEEICRFVKIFKVSYDEFLGRK